MIIIMIIIISSASSTGSTARGAAMPRVFVIMCRSGGDASMFCVHAIRRPRRSSTRRAGAGCREPLRVACWRYGTREAAEMLADTVGPMVPRGGRGMPRAASCGASFWRAATRTSGRTMKRCGHETQVKTSPQVACNSPRVATDPGRTMKRCGHEKQVKTFHGPVATRCRDVDPRSGRRAWDGERGPVRKAVPPPPPPTTPPRAKQCVV